VRKFCFGFVAFENLRRNIEIAGLIDISLPLLKNVRLCLFIILLQCETVHRGRHNNRGKVVEIIFYLLESLLVHNSFKWTDHTLNNKCLIIEYLLLYEITNYTLFVLFSTELLLFTVRTIPLIEWMIMLLQNPTVFTILCDTYDHVPDFLDMDFTGGKSLKFLRYQIRLD